MISKRSDDLREFYDSWDNIDDMYDWFEVASGTVDLSKAAKICRIEQSSSRVRRMVVSDFVNALQINMLTACHLVVLVSSGFQTCSR